MGHLLLAVCIFSFVFVMALMKVASEADQEAERQFQEFMERKHRKGDFYD